MSGEGEAEIDVEAFEFVLGFGPGQPDGVGGGLLFFSLRKTMGGFSSFEESVDCGLCPMSSLILLRADENASFKTRAE